MNRNIEKLQALVDDVMDVYKLDMGKLKFSLTDTDITKLINEAILEPRPLTLLHEFKRENFIGLSSSRGTTWDFGNIWITMICYY